MKKLILSIAVIAFISFTAGAQNNQGANATDAKKESVSKTSDAAPAKAGCASSMKCCHSKTSASTDASSKSCCKGKSAKDCKHDGTKAEGTSSGDQNAEKGNSKAGNPK